MRETVYKLVRNWSVGEIWDVALIPSGTSCESFLVEASSGKYILRGFSSQHQAEQESAVSRMLLGTEIGAMVLPTQEGAYYVSYDGRFYNLQNFLPGVQPDFLKERQLVASAEATAKMHKAFSLYRYPLLSCDRFSAIQLLLQTDGLPLPIGLFPENVTTMEERVHFIQKLEKELSEDQIIHGDLGAWNMLWNGECVHIIDFGECRTGDIHFDLAALICSMLSKCKDVECFSHNLSQVLDTYEGIAGSVDMRKLHISVYLWLLRGALASAVYTHDCTKRKFLCQHFTNELIRYRHYTHNEGIKDFT